MDRYGELREALRQNRLDRAAELCHHLLALAPEDPEIVTLAGTLAYRRGDLSAALPLFEKAASLNPQLPQVHNNVGVLLQDLGRHEAALSCYLKAIELRPHYAEAMCNLGNALRRLGREDVAIASYRRAIAIDPAYPDSYLNLGNALRAAGMWQKAVENYQKFLQRNPCHLPGWINLAGSLQALNRFQEATAAGRRAVEIDSGSADAHWNLALSLLAAGDFRHGWREYEWRLRRSDVPFSHEYAGRAMWDGSPLRGRTLLLRAEQGLGDALQFFRYARLLASRGERIIFECRPELLQLFSSQRCGVHCIAVGEEPPSFDTFAYFMSLPFLLGTTLETIPGATPYLEADVTLAAEWDQRMPGARLMRVGLVWAGSASYRNDASRSLQPRLLQPLATLPGLQLISLQIGAAAAELAHEPWGAAVHQPSSGIRDFSDTAAIIANLDVVVSVDTAVAHLAGALGKRVLLMLPYSCDWRWLHDREDSPWYPTVRLFRQRAPGDWSGVVATVRRQLGELLAQRSRPEPVIIDHGGERGRLLQWTWPASLSRFMSES
jgi:tetratricopeptide (TPR) repeat protein